MTQQPVGNEGAITSGRSRTFLQQGGSQHFTSGESEGYPREGGIN